MRMSAAVSALVIIYVSVVRSTQLRSVDVPMDPNDHNEPFHYFYARFPAGYSEEPSDQQSVINTMQLAVEDNNNGLQQPSDIVKERAIRDNTKRTARENMMGTDEFTAPNVAYFSDKHAIDGAEDQNIRAYYGLPEATLITTRVKRESQEEQEPRSSRAKRWHKSSLPSDKNTLHTNDEHINNDRLNQLAQQYLSFLRQNKTQPEYINLIGQSLPLIDEFQEIKKKSFSPWGGKKRLSSDIESGQHAFNWKRAPEHKETSMPKRVRFSPWGGKRGGNLVYKPGANNEKIVFTSALPELWLTQYNIAQGQRKESDITNKEKRAHSLQVVKLHNMDTLDNGRGILPFKEFPMGIAKAYKTGQPYIDMTLKNDGKRKVKFSAWGGKRTAPLIGPRWTALIPSSDMQALVLVTETTDTKLEQDDGI